MAHKKAGGSTALGRDSQPKYLGVKLLPDKKHNPEALLFASEDRTLKREKM